MITTDPAHLYTSPMGYERMRDWYDRALTQLDMPYTALTVPTRHGETHVLAFGAEDAPPLVLLHGWNGNALMWEKQFATFAAHYRVYAPDIIGAAGKSAPTRLAYNGDGYAEWLSDVFDALHITRAGIAGISGGGYVCLAFAGYAPQKVEKMALMSTCGLTALRLPYDITRVEALTRLNAAVIGNFIPSQKTAVWLMRRLTPAKEGVYQYDDPHIAEMFYILVKYFRNQSPPGPIPPAQLQRCTQPTLLLMGQHEHLFAPHAVIAQARRTLPNLCAAEIVPNAGHGMNADQPAYVNARLLRFLQEGT